jgi:Mce-associated membrane protein
MTTSEPDPSGSADELARAAEAEAEAAQARAEAARARAAELRSKLEAATEATEAGDAREAGEAGDAREADGTTAEGSAGLTESMESPPRPPSVLLQTVAVAATTLVIAGLSGATGYMAWQHHTAAQQNQSAAEFAAAARQDVVNLMSMDYNKSQESVQRVLDGSTGKFRANFDETADEFAKALRDEKIITSATVNDAAVDSMTGDSAVVLVSATSRREGKQAPKDQQQPRVWRIVLTLEREGDQIKMSGVEFI